MTHHSNSARPSSSRARSQPKAETVSIPVRYPHKHILSVLIALTLIMLTFISGGKLSLAADEIGIVIVDNLNLRPEPGTGSPPLKTLQKGSEVIILNRRNGWLKVRHSELVGYIQNRENFIHIVSVDQRRESGTARSGSVNKIQRYKQEAEDLSHKIEKAEKQVRGYTSQEVNILTHLNRIDYSIDQAGRRISKNRAGLKVLSEKIAITRTAYKKLVKEIDQKEEYASRRLVALYKTNRLGTLQFLASSGTIYEMLYRKKSLEQILTYDESIRAKLLNDKARLKEILDRLNDQLVKKRSIKAAIKTEIKSLSKNKADRSKMLEEIRTQKSLQVAALDSLNKAAEALDQTINTLTEQPAEQLKGISIHSFSELKGLLKMPVKGKIISFFGPHRNSRFKVSVFRSGIDVKAKRGAVIQAVYTGRILYAEWFKGYGNMIIIDHGDSYYTVYAHLHELYKNKGDYVNTGEDIATVGDTGSMIGPVLHFEVRHHGKPLDPLKWLAKG